MANKQRPIGENMDNDRNKDALHQYEKKKLLVITKGWFHPSLQVRRIFRTLLMSLHKDYQFTFTSKLDDLSRLEYDTNEDTVKPYDGLILLFHEKVLPPRLLEIIKRYLAGGGGLMAVHGALASFKAMSDYTHILGSKFTGHGAPGEIKVTKVYEDSKTNESNRSYNSFTIKDELYLFDFDKANHVLWRGESGGERAPVVWTRTDGTGRIFCFSLGHYASTFKNGQVKSIIIEGLSWITGEEASM